MKTSLDNITLIQKFLKGEDSLLANRDLRVEKVREEIQLLTHQGILLAKANFTQQLPKVVIRLRSDYWDLVHQLALNAGFIPLNIQEERLSGSTFGHYEHHSVPDGYQIHCQEASALWKTWWVNHRSLELMDLLILLNKRWYPINQMVCETGSIYIKTWRGEQTIAISDMVVWLDRNTQEQRKRINVRNHHQQQLTTQSAAAKKSAAALESQSLEAHKSTQQPVVPEKLRQVVKAGHDKIIVHTVLGPVLIKGQNLSCSLARRTSSAS